ncbi:DUF5937 family protein [Deinococcus hopiensis]|uniref:Helix-turn-helix domain-containing protein n=1 Tax=Deinococcus hopiensis KR-140 TaxID=695939 RepID=A0A1W1UKV6_9DEIO|nr:DUF5937 family protein [Deinococcus hopiensis]SMB81707.1 Helix-turn-helix domain-containing protein [Deinococcus hopiensis KR-140]
MSIHFVLEAEDLSRLRFAFSPMWEGIMSLRVLQQPALAALHLPWIRETRQQLPFRKPDPYLTLAMQLVNAQQYMPDFLTPPPSTPFPDFEEELARVASTPEYVVRREVTRTFPNPEKRSELVRALMDEPSLSLHRMVQSIGTYWERHLAVHWPRMLLMLEADVTLRGRILALSGPGSLFEGLHASLTFQNGVLTRQSDSEQTVHVRGQGLVLVPSLFCWAQVLTLRDPPWQPTVIYPARGAANLWHAVPEPYGALEHLLGTSCARILSALRTPSTTLELAHLFGLVPGAVSFQLSKLRQTGLVEGQRLGRAVYYRWTNRGEALLELFPPERSSSSGGREKGKGH